MTVHESECVAIKRRGAEYVAKLLAGKTPDEQLAFWQQRTEALLAKQVTGKSRSPKVSPNKAMNPDA